MAKNKKIKTEQKPYQFEGSWWLACKVCGKPTKVADETIMGIKCWKCLQAASVALLPEIEKDKLFGIQKISSKKPAGWHFMTEFVDKDGTVYHKGKEIPELNGTLKPTKLKPGRKKKRKVNIADRPVDKMSEKKILELAKVHKEKQKNKK